MINKLAKQIHKGNAEKGFWDEERNVGEMLMLVVTELAEAMEAHRKGKFTEPLNKIEWEDDFDNITDSYDKQMFLLCVKDSFEDEIADAVIRILDLCGGLDINIEKHIELKLKYNATRPRLHGKNY